MSDLPRDARSAWPPLHETGLSVAELDLHGGALFWEEVRVFTGASPLASLVQEVLDRREVPRIWLFLDEPEETATRAAAALAAARALVARRLSVIVVDGDAHRPDLTRWAGRYEREGWVDFVRYGASLAACTEALPWDEAVGRLLGVGSFVPAEVGATEASWLLSLLGSQADFVLISAALGPGGTIWAEPAALRILCWDRSGRSPGDTVAWLDTLAAEARPAHAVVTFGAPGLALLPPPPPEAIEAARSLERFAAAVAAAAAGDTAPSAAVLPADAPAPSRAAPDEGPRPAVLLAPIARAGARSLRWVWWVVAGTLTALVAAWWLGGRAPRPQVPLSSLAPPGTGADISRPAARETSASDTSAEVTGSGPSGSAPTPAGVAAGDTAREGAGAAAARDSVTAVPSVRAPVESTVAAPAEGGFDPAPYRLPVGQDGWVLHVYSLPDSALAARQVTALARLGLSGRWRAVELPGKGRWYRIYMGSFPSREAAQAALPALLRRLGEEWGQVARF